MVGGGRQDGPVLDRFSPAARDWFTGAFAAPTAAQLGAWQAISAGEHALVVAPTGSGKTLAAFFWALDELARSPVPEQVTHRCRVLYVSPLKALAVDVERNLRGPLTGLRQAATRLGLPVPEVRVGLRSGDTPAEERRSFTRTPPDILITTPESLFLLLTSRAREALAGVGTVIVDEVHALAGSKRGAHLALSLERLDALLAAPAQRVGLSATVRPVEDVARWLGGAGERRVAIVQPPSAKVFDLSVVVPVPDMGDLDGLAPPGTPAPGRAAEPDLDLSGPAAGELRRPSIWPHVEERVVDLVGAHRSTLVFANSRRLAERLTARLNEVWAERLTGEAPVIDSAPAEVMAQSGAAAGAPPVLARAHHGSVSKEQRAIIEGELKAGRLPAVVATSSLELGIDMGAVDLVVQVESPPSVASGLQRVGRAGHQVGAISRGVLFPKYRSDLVQTAVVVERMRDGAIEALRVPANPLDVLAQQLVAMLALDDWSVDDVEALVRRAAPFGTLTRPVLEAVLDMLSGRYPSDEFAELRPRIVWDRLTGTLSGRPGAQRLAVTSGGTIPDRGLFGVFLAGESAAAGGSGGRGGRSGGRRVGELDEEMVYESRVGDVFTLGSTSWRIEEITHDRVLVTPAPGQPGRLPFWHGDAQGRPAELGRAVGAFVREIVALDDAAARARAGAAGLDAWASDNLLAYLREQQAATRHVPDDRTIVIERFRDELGDWRVVLHSPFGAQVHAPWALALAERLRERYGVDVQAMPADDGIVLRLPDVEPVGFTDAPEPMGAAELADLVMLEPGDVESLVTETLGGSALFAARFRECAARALLLPRRRPDRRQPLWQQRQRAAQLLEVASRYGSFPIVLETVRECLQDVFDVPGLVTLMRDLAARSVKIVEVTTTEPSPFARSLMFGYVAQFLYEGDSPLAERRAAALALDPALLSELLGRGEGASLRDLLDPAAVERTESELQRLAPTRRLVGLEGVADLLRLLGPTSLEELCERTLTEPWRGEPSEPSEQSEQSQQSGQSQADPLDAGGDLAAPVAADVVQGWLSTLESSRRVIRVRIAGQERWAAVEDAGRLRDALGTPLPVGVAEAFTEPVADPLGDLVSRYARTHGPFTATSFAQRFGLGVAVVTEALRRLVAAGRLAEGELRPLECGGGQGTDYCDREVLRTLRRRSVAALRAEVEPVAAADLARFLPTWQGITDQAGRLRGSDGVLRAVEQLAGALVPASALETLILPGRVTGYSPVLLDELLSSGEVLWAGHGALPGDDGWVSLHPTDIAPLTLAPPDPLFTAGELHTAVLSVLGGGGAFFFRPLSQAVWQVLSDATPDATTGPDDAVLAEALWDLTWAGWITNDSLSALRTRMAGGRTAHRTRPAPPRSRYGGRYSGLRAAQASRAAAGGVVPGRLAMPTRSGPPTVAGRWSLLPERDGDATVRAHAQGEVLLERHGVLTRGAVIAEGVVGAFAGTYRVLSAFEDAGRVRRGYFVEGLGAAQFASTGAIDRLRAMARPVGDDSPTNRQTIVLAAADPANPYGAALPWPARPAETGQHKPGRKAGAVVVLVDGALVLYVERGGRSLLSWSQEATELQAAADALALAVRDGALGKLTVERADGEGVLGSDHPLARALAEAGFRATPRGLRMRI
ncbi:MAG: DEAD/DEAH box helicase [Kineosporiaceae bacterium]|nr:DEAD/DEAH box helicase [Kineosporiaceae bacterium]